MALIFYSMCGEGRGHATRVRAMVEVLRHEHELVLFAPGDAYDLLAPRCADTGVEIHRIPGLRFHYNARESLDFWATTRETVSYVWRLPRLINWLEGHIHLREPDLAITDFEPALPRAAARCGVPFVSLDHQHFLVENDLGSLPSSLRTWSAAMGLAVRAFYRGQAATIVSSFYSPPLRRPRAGVEQVGVLLRPEIVEAEPRHGDFLVAYLRRKTARNVVEALEQLGRPVRIYGLGRQAARGCLEFRAIDELGFVEDLAGCAAVVCTAGNQLVGEALFLQKPVLALPEINNFEQSINAHFLRQGGGGDWVAPEKLTVGNLQRFLRRLDVFKSQIARQGLNGLPAAAAAIQRQLVDRRRKVPMLAAY